MGEVLSVSGRYYHRPDFARPHAGDSICEEMATDHALQIVLIAVLLPFASAIVQRKVGRDYREMGRLTSASSALQISVIVLHAASSYVLLDSRLSAIDTGSPLFGIALLLMAGGLIILVTTLVRLGVHRTVGQNESGLTCSGMYRRTRNPQVISYGIAVLGYALLWPSWNSVLWVVLYAVIAQMMVRTEEKHLRQAYGNDYVAYCQRTPRYMDLPGLK